MNLALQIGSNQISFDQVLQKMSEAQLLPELLREIITDELIRRVAQENQIDLTPTSEELDRLIAQVINIRPFQGMNSDQIATIATRTIRIHKFKQAGWGDKVSSYYQAIQHQLYRISYSILQVEDGLLAQELFFRVQSGEQPFSEIAIQHSQDPSASKGGLIGPILSRTIDPSILNIIQPLALKQLSPLFKINNNYGFIRLDEIIIPQLDDGTQQMLLDELFNNWIRDQIGEEIGVNGSASISPTTTVIEQSTATLDQIFAPDFTPQEIDFTSQTVIQIGSNIPEVTIVEEAENLELSVATEFYFPNDQSHPPSPKSNPSTAIESSPNSSFILPPESQSIKPAINEAWGRSTKLAIAVTLLAITIVGSIVLKESTPKQETPAPVSR